MREKRIIKKKEIILTISIIAFGVLLVGATYAYLTNSANITNGNYASNVECFDINYGIENTDGTTNIEGTLFPTASASGGLSGDVSLNVNSNCNVTGTGTLKLHVSTKYRLVGYVSAYCADPLTLESVSSYTEQTTCESAGYTWVAEGSALKYKVVDSSGNILSVGNVLYADESGSVLVDDDSDVSFDIPLYTGFLVDNTVRNYTVYIWMDGYLIDENYSDISFSGYINASVTQNE